MPKLTGDRYDYLYTAAELEQLRRLSGTLVGQTRRTHVIFNNHNDGKAFAIPPVESHDAPLRAARAPASLVGRFPGLRAWFKSTAEQLPLV